MESERYRRVAMGKFGASRTYRYEVASASASLMILVQVHVYM